MAPRKNSTPKPKARLVGLLDPHAVAEATEDELQEFAAKIADTATGKRR